MLARTAARGREMSVRMTLGAGRSRLVQQLLTESLLLAVVAGGLGLVVAMWGSRLLVAIASVGHAPIPLDLTPDARVLAFTAGVTLLTVVLFGLLPALRATRVDLASALRAQGRNLTGARGRIGRIPLGKALVIGQVALSTLLLVGAGLLVRSMQRILSADLGLDREHVIIAEVGASKRGYAGARVSALMRDLADRARRVPGVTAASYSLEGVFSGGESSGHVEIAGFVPQADSQRAVKDDEVGPDFFHAIGAHLLRGRDFAARDGGGTVAAINETMAKFYFAGVDPIGRTVTMDSTTYTIAGVVRDVEEADVRAKPVRRLYIPVRQHEHPQSFVMEVRVAGDPPQFVGPIRDALLAADRAIPLDISPLPDLVRESVAQDVLVTQVTTFFGIVALVLAALGLYGVTAYATTQRTSELGLRVALGAEPTNLVAMIVGEALSLTVAGVAIGLPAGLGAARLIRGQIFGVGTVDPPSLAVAVAVLVGVSLVAGYLPARRAARIGPLEALRAE
jgi:predicted permease